MIAVAMVTRHFWKPYDNFLRLGKTKFMNWFKTCDKIILQRHNVCLEITFKTYVRINLKTLSVNLCTGIQCLCLINGQ